MKRILCIICLILLLMPIKVRAYDKNDIYTLAKLVEAEAGNQDEYGKRLVCDVVLNRVLDPRFPDTINDVIFQKNQFAVAYTGLIHGPEPKEETFKLVEEELIDQVDYDVLFFCNSYYNGNTPLYIWGDHYFSK